jgi:hypothetical protein
MTQPFSDPAPIIRDVSEAYMPPQGGFQQPCDGLRSAAAPAVRITACNFLRALPAALRPRRRSSVPPQSTRANSRAAA